MNSIDGLGGDDDVIQPHTVAPPKEGKVHSDAHEHHEISDSDIEKTHEVLGFSGKPFLILDSDASKFERRGINIGDHIKSHDTSFFGPGAMSALLLQNKRGNVQVNIGRNSNFQEILPIQVQQDQEAVIYVGERSSLAHAVKIEMPKGRRKVQLDIGNNVFVGIGTHLANCSIGDNCSIGFECELKKDVEVGAFSTICDGSKVEEGLKIPKFTVVRPGLKVDKAVLDTGALSPEEYAKQNSNGIRDIRNLIQFTPEQQERIFAAELEEKGRGNVAANKILEEAGVDASSLFLSQFNAIVVAENRLFPLLYRLIEKFHPEQMLLSDKSKQGPVKGKNVMMMNLPADREKFIEHYVDQIKAGIKEDEIKPYNGEFTKCRVAEDVSLEGNTYLIGNIEIGDGTVIGQNFTVRGDEMGMNDKVEISGTIGEDVTIHASGSKKFEKVKIGNRCVLHGSQDLRHCKIEDDAILHQVKASDCIVCSHSIMLGVDMKGCGIGEDNTIIGHSVKGNNHNGKIQLSSVNTGGNVVISHHVKMEGQGVNGSNIIWVDDGVLVNHDCLIKGAGQIGENCLFNPGALYELNGELPAEHVVLADGTVINREHSHQLISLVEDINVRLSRIPETDFEIRRIMVDQRDGLMKQIANLGKRPSTIPPGN
jgi:carbonic anhydrase/acetyltransferase-like protein (isoleucine patch superfamily)